MSETHRLTLNQSASCACGQVTLSLAGRVLSMFLCACLECQKASGTGHAEVVLARRETVTLTGPRTHYARPAASGATFTREFCPACGAPILGHSSRAPEIFMIPVGLFAPDNAWFAPNQVIFARSHQAWDTIADHLPRHQTYKEGLAP